MRKITLAILNNGCISQEYKLREKEISFVPYNGSEQLLYVSDKSDSFEIQLTGFKRKMIEGNNNTPMGALFEQITLTYLHGSGRMRREDYFCFITASAKGAPYIGIYLDGVNGRSFRSALPLDSVDNLATSDVYIQGKKINDIIVIPSEDKEISHDNKKFVNRIFWSKSKGLVKIECADSTEYYLAGNVPEKHFLENRDK